MPDRVKSQADRFRPTAQQKSMIGCLPEYKDIETRILYKDRQGGYWVFTHSGLDRVVFNKKRLSPVKRSSEGEEFIRCIFQYGADDIFVADKNGVICVWDKVGNTKDTYVVTAQYLSCVIRLVQMPIVCLGTHMGICG